MKSLSFFLFLSVCVLLLASAYLAESPIGAAVRADYIQAQVHKESAEARKQQAQAIEQELENAYSERIYKQRLVHNHQSWMAAEARRDDLGKARERAVGTLALATAAAIVIIGLALAIGGVRWMRVYSRIKLLQAREREAQARAGAYEKEQRAYQARAVALKEQQDLLVQQHQFELARLIAEGKPDEKAHAQRPASRVN